MSPNPVCLELKLQAPLTIFETTERPTNGAPEVRWMVCVMERLELY